MIYVDSSVPLLALMEQTGGSETAAALDEHRGEALRKASSALLDVEVSRVLRREGLDPALADALLDSIDLVVIDDEVVQRAKALTGELKSLDAIHLATALMLDHPRDPVVLLTHIGQTILSFLAWTNEPQNLEIAAYRRSVPMAM